MAVTTYTATARVAAYNSKRTYTTSSKPSLTQVSYIISDVFADMNARMSSVGLTVPITTSPATDASKFLRMVHAIGSAAYIEESAFMGGNKQESEHVNSLMKKYEAYMLQILKNPSMISSAAGSLSSLEYNNTDEQRGTEPFERSVHTW